MSSRVEAEEGNRDMTYLRRDDIAHLHRHVVEGGSHGSGANCSCITTRDRDCYSSASNFQLPKSQTP
jgi:hypothetical protein